MSCKGVCMCHKASSGYVVGHKRCRSCDLFIKMGRIMLSLLWIQIKKTPRDVNLNTKLREQSAIEEAQKLEYYE
ncbi:MAG: hypothetical protein ACJ71M_03705 [Nitrososphaeraceae archaeon]